MQTYADKSQENQCRSTVAKARNGQQQKDSFHFANNRPEVAQMKRLRELTNNNSRFKKAQFPKMADERVANQEQHTQNKPIHTGLPDNLKKSIESLSGYSMDDVKVHYNSSKPAQFKAHAYAQGTDIHLTSGQEKHLPHEAWHVVQQKQGRVKPTIQLKGGVSVNNDPGLEQEADLMGKKAIQLFSNQNVGNSVPLLKTSTLSAYNTVQRVKGSVGFELQAYNAFALKVEGEVGNGKAKYSYSGSDVKPFHIDNGYKLTNDGGDLELVITANKIEGDNHKGNAEEVEKFYNTFIENSTTIDSLQKDLANQKNNEFNNILDALVHVNNETLYAKIKEQPDKWCFNVKQYGEWAVVIPKPITNPEKHKIEIEPQATFGVSLDDVRNAYSSLAIKKVLWNEKGYPGLREKLLRMLARTSDNQLSNKEHEGLAVMLASNILSANQTKYPVMPKDLLVFMSRTNPADALNNGLEVQDKDQIHKRIVALVDEAEIDLDEPLWKVDEKTKQEFKKFGKYDEITKKEEYWKYAESGSRRKHIESVLSMNNRTIGEEPIDDNFAKLTKENIDSGKITGVKDVGYIDMQHKGVLIEIRMLMRTTNNDISSLTRDIVEALNNESPKETIFEEIKKIDTEHAERAKLQEFYSIDEQTRGDIIKRMNLSSNMEQQSDQLREQIQKLDNNLNTNIGKKTRFNNQKATVEFKVNNFKTKLDKIQANLNQMKSEISASEKLPAPTQAALSKKIGKLRNEESKLKGNIKNEEKNIAPKIDKIKTQIKNLEEENRLTLNQKEELKLKLDIEDNLYKIYNSYEEIFLQQVKFVRILQEKHRKQKTTER